MILTIKNKFFFKKNCFFTLRWLINKTYFLNIQCLFFSNNTLAFHKMPYFFIIYLKWMSMWKFDNLFAFFFFMSLSIVSLTISIDELMSASKWRFFWLIFLIFVFKSEADFADIIIIIIDDFCQSFVFLNLNFVLSLDCDLITALTIIKKHLQACTIQFWNFFLSLTDKWYDDIKILFFIIFVKHEIIHFFNDKFEKCIATLWIFNLLKYVGRIWCNLNQQQKIMEMMTNALSHLFKIHDFMWVVDDWIRPQSDEKKNCWKILINSLTAFKINMLLKKIK